MGNCELSEHELYFVKFTCANGAIQLRKQCIKCGYTDSHNYPKRIVKNIDELEFFNNEKRDLFIKKENEKRQLLWEEKHANNLEELNKYYNSDKWKIKREYVLKRDKYICQACLTNKATQVHHLSYMHVTNEPLFELVSICKRCHDKLTELDRKNMNL